MVMFYLLRYTASVSPEFCNNGVIGWTERQTDGRVGLTVNCWDNYNTRNSGFVNGVERTMPFVLDLLLMEAEFQNTSE